jgi:hypothetical protein
MDLRTKIDAGSQREIESFKYSCARIFLHGGMSFIWTGEFGRVSMFKMPRNP